VRDGRVVSQDARGDLRTFELADDPPAAAGPFRPGEFQLRAATASATSSAALVTAAAAEARTTIAPNNYSGAGWRNGVMEVEGKDNDMFYFLVAGDGPLPLAVGDRVKVAAGGNATVIRVDASKQGTVTAVFVQVNRDLNPHKDGFPHTVRVLPR
jgi:hypothetical protein